MTERGLKNINVFYSTFKNVFLFLSRFYYKFFNVFYFFWNAFLHLCSTTPSSISVGVTAVEVEDIVTKAVNAATTVIRGDSQ